MDTEINFEQFLEAKRNKLLQENTNHLLNNLDKYETKINNLCKKHPDLNFSNIKEMIKQKNPFAIALIRKDTIRQNITEKAFFEFTGLIRLPQTGKSSVRFNNSKAADFKIGNWFGTQKYIKESGGAQDNQINDAVYFAKQGISLNKKIIICIDGDYGKRKIRQVLKNNNAVSITSADELKKDLLNGRYN